MARWLNVPNLLTISRLVLTPFVVHAISTGRHLLALELFSIAALTDWLDGLAARRFHTKTRGGAYLDPIADKCLMSGVFLALALSGTVPWWLVILIFARDIYILIGASLFLLFTSVRNLPPTVWGKLSTFVQILTAVISMGRNALRLPLLDFLAPVMVWPCAAITIWSGLDYTWRGIRLAKDR